MRLRPDATATFTDPTGRTRTTHPIDALHTLVLPASEHPESTVAPAPPVDADLAGEVTDVSGATDRFSAVEFTLDHALAGLTRVDHEHRAALHRIPRLHDDHATDITAATITITGISRADRLRIDLHHPHTHRRRSDRLVLADNCERDPAHRTSRRGPGHSGQGDEPSF